MIEDWNLGTIKRQVREELGLQDVPQHNSEIVNKINLAQSHIVRRRPNWPWMRKEIVIDIQSISGGTGDFTQGQATANLYEGTPTKRDIMIVGGSTGDATIGYLVKNVVPFVQVPGMGLSPATLTVTFQSQFRGISTTNSGYGLQTGFKQLPKDFIRMDTSADLDSLSGDRVKYKTPKLFEGMKRTQPGPGLGNRYYTIKPDPLSEEKRMYICFYPYISSITTIQGEYFAMPDRMSDDTDIPAVSVGDRDVLFYFSCWFMATSKGMENSVFYRDQALSDLERMTKEYELSDDLDRDDSWDVDWVAPPSSFPWWDEQALIL